MSDVVKAQRSYDSSRRQEQARRNRQAVLAAAQRLFLANGYGATTIGHIAKAARVSVETIYKAFATKAGVLKAVFDVTVAGDDEPIPMVERDEIKAVIAEPDPARKIRRYAEYLATVQPRLAPIQLLVRDAAATDPGAAEVWGQLRAEMLTAMTMFADELIATGGLKPDLPADDVRDLLWTFNSVEFYELLVLARGWPPERYAEFMADALVAALVPASHA